MASPKPVTFAWGERADDALVTVNGWTAHRSTLIDSVVLLVLEVVVFSGPEEPHKMKNQQ